MCKLQSVKALLESLFVWLKLKEIPFQVFHAASSAEVDVFWSNILRIDAQLTKEDISSRIVQSRPGLKKFLDNCFQERLYSFSIKKCGSTTCSIYNPPQLAAEVFSTLHHLSDPVPDITGEHYRNFEDLYGTPTSEKYRPSMTEGGRKPHELPLQPNAQYARNVGMTMQCCECLKPRAFTPSTSSGFKMNYVCKDSSQIYFIAGSQLSDLIAEDSSPLHKDLLGRVICSSKSNLCRQGRNPILLFWSIWRCVYTLWKSG